MQINYVANNTFMKVHRDPNRFLFVRGPVGSGKSSGCILHLFMNALKQVPDSDGVRNSRYAIIRASYPALATTVVKSWKQWFKDMIKIVMGAPIRGTVALPLPDGTRVNMELNFIALDREEDVNKLQSLELTASHINEAAEIPPGVHQMLKSRVNRFPASMDGGAIDPFIICDYNSVDVDHWLYRLAEEVQPNRHSFYHQPPALLMCSEADGIVADAENNFYRINPEADNLGHWEAVDRGLFELCPPAQAAAYTQDGTPLRRNPSGTLTGDLIDVWFKHLDPDYYVDQVAGADPDWVNIFILNNYGALRQGRPVYKAYQDKYHATDRPIKPLEGLPITIGVDVGLTPAAAFCQLTPTGSLIILDEIVTENTSIQEFAEDHLWPLIKNKYMRFNFELVIDPAARNRSQNDKRSAMDILVQAGLPTRLAKTNNELARREAVNFFLRKQSGFQLSQLTANTLRKGFISEYKFAKVVQSVRLGEKYKEKPEKNIYSHVHDALQYACLELSEGRTMKRKARPSSHSRYNTPADSGAGY